MSRLHQLQAAAQQSSSVLKKVMYPMRIIPITETILCHKTRTSKEMWSMHPPCGYSQSNAYCFFASLLIPNQTQVAPSPTITSPAKPTITPIAILAPFGSEGPPQEIAASHGVPVGLFFAYAPALERCSLMQSQSQPNHS